MPLHSPYSYSRAAVRHAAALERALFVLFTLSVIPASATSQKTMPRDTTPMAGMAMSMVPDPLGVSMDRLGSGTTWIPDGVSLPSRRFNSGAWNFMLHGFVFGQYETQRGPRGGSQFGSLNWGMLMATHELASGRFQVRTMLSLDALGVSPRGYPLLLQTGEAYNGVPFHDRQHPHDLFMELGAMYDRPVTSRIGLTLYAAPSGEPALGPVAFMHRPSAMDIPTAPIGHHWQDATHIAFGVLTAGLFTQSVRVEGSVFNGRDPNQNRWDLDPIKLDSYSGRVSYNPNTHWALNGGYGYIKSPDALTPNVSEHRVTGSAMYGKKFGEDGQLATTFVWGANMHSDRPGLSHSGLIESEAVLDRLNTVFGRVELVQKSADDLVLVAAPDNFAPTQSFNVGAVALGYIREILPLRATTLGLGAMGTLNIVPPSLESAYGSRTPLSLFVFLRLRPIASRDGGMTGMQGMSSMGALMTTSAAVAR